MILKPRKRKILKAFSVIDKEEHTGGIVFASTAKEAERKGAIKYEMYDPRVTPSTRAPYADCYSDTGIVPASTLIENGWTFSCSSCGETIDDDAFNERDFYPCDVCGNQDGPIFCNKTCKAKYEYIKALTEHFGLRWRRRLARLVKSKIPSAQIIPETIMTKPYVDKTKNGYKINDIRVEFKIPEIEDFKGLIKVKRSKYENNAQGGKKARRITFSCEKRHEDAFREILAK